MSAEDEARRTRLATEPAILIEESPRATFLRHAAAGELAFQRSVDGTAIFYPRVIAPGSGEEQPRWEVSSGRGTVYASTTVRRRGEEAHNVAMIELEEGFRMMSAVVDVDPEQVGVGLPVRVEFRSLEDGDVLPVFVPVEAIR